MNESLQKIFNSQNQEKTYPQENDDKTEQLISSWSSRWDTICKSGIENNFMRSTL